MQRPCLKSPLKLDVKEQQRQTLPSTHLQPQPRAQPPAETPRTPTPQSALARVGGQVGRAEGPSATQACRVRANLPQLPAGHHLGLVPLSHQSVLHGCYFSEPAPCLGLSPSWGLDGSRVASSALRGNRRGTSEGPGEVEGADLVQA